MKRNLAHFSLDSRNYQHPESDWVCGHLAEGNPCPLGPNSRGECCADDICHPQFDGKTWHCRRPESCGGICEEGPVPEPGSPDQHASCPHRRARCQPVRSLRSKRRLLTALTSVLALGFCLLMLGGSTNNEPGQILDTTSLISPGPLSAAHATLDAGCEACHSASKSAPGQMLSQAWSLSTIFHESSNCLKCHQDLGDFALNPHSMNPEQLVQTASHTGNQKEQPNHTTRQALARWLNGTPTTDAKHDCATCHREHRGAEHDLTALTNARCQSCHQQTFHSFASGHPQIPPPPRAGIHFDHVTHFKQHFKNYERLMPDGVPLHNCQDCHTLAANESTMNLASYAKMCGSCHDEQIRDFLMPEPMRLDHLEFLKQLPAEATDSTTVDSTIKQILGVDIPLFLQLLLMADPNAAEALNSIPASAVVNRTEEIEATRTTIVAAWEALLEELINNRAEAVYERLLKVCDNDTDQVLLKECAQALEASFFFEAILAFQNQMSSEAAENETYFGNWWVVRDRNALIYRPSQHEDRLLTAWLDLLASNTPAKDYAAHSSSKNLFTRFLRDRVAPEAAGRCLKCHTISESDAGRLTVNWQTSHENKSRHQFTFFSHGPHLTFMQKSDSSRAINQQINNCESCHPLQEVEPDFLQAAFRAADGMPLAKSDAHATLGLKPVQQQNCAQCHQKNLAGDNCLQCHNYHIHP